MNTSEFYSPRRQLSRALASDWRLSSFEMLYGMLYVLVPFYCSRRVGLSQVYDVILPFVVVTGLMAFLTWRICNTDVKTKSAAYFASLPGDRNTAFSARILFLFSLTLWFVAVVFIGCLFKLGGAGITASYRIHPEFVALPFLAVASTAWLVYCPHDKSHWILAVLSLILFFGALYTRIAAIGSIPANEGNHYWPGRESSLSFQFLVSGVLILVTSVLIINTRKQWHSRQIGEIR